MSSSQAPGKLRLCKKEEAGLPAPLRAELSLSTLQNYLCCTASISSSFHGGACGAWHVLLKLGHVTRMGP